MFNAELIAIKSHDIPCNIVITCILKTTKLHVYFKLIVMKDVCQAINISGVC